MKSKRHTKIVELIMENEVETQEELALLLKEGGFDVTQATVSRDIRELALTKLVMPDGKQKYVILQPEAPTINNKLNRVFVEGVISVDFAQNIIVIKTFVGMAMAVAAALDGMELPEVMGSIAGDDTLFCVTKDMNQALLLMDKLKSILEK